MGSNARACCISTFLGTVIGFAVAFGLVAWVDGLPAWKQRLPFISATRQGTAYAVSNVAGTSYQEVDKIIMLLLLGAATVGSYTVAFRVASIFVLPLSALIGVFLPRMMNQYNEREKVKHLSYYHVSCFNLWCFSWHRYISCYSIFTLGIWCRLRGLVVLFTAFCGVANVIWFTSSISC